MAIPMEIRSFCSARRLIKRDPAEHARLPASSNERPSTGMSTPRMVSSRSLFSRMYPRGHQRIRRPAPSDRLHRPYCAGDRLQPLGCARRPQRSRRVTPSYPAGHAIPPARSVARVQLGRLIRLSRYPHLTTCCLSLPAHEPFLVRRQEWISLPCAKSMRVFSRHIQPPGERLRNSRSATCARSSAAVASSTDLTGPGSGMADSGVESI